MKNFLEANQGGRLYMTTNIGHVECLFDTLPCGQIPSATNPSCKSIGALPKLPDRLLPIEDYRLLTATSCLLTYDQHAMLTI